MDDQPDLPPRSRLGVEEAWATEQYIRLGLRPWMAWELAAGQVSWHRAVALLERGCSPRDAYRILRP